MTNASNSCSAALRLSTILLALACLCGCQSTSTGSSSLQARQPARAEASGHRSIDRAYLLAVAKLDEEKKQALEDSRLKELSPAQMRQVEDSFESRRQQLRAQWQEARARHTQ